MMHVPEHISVTGLPLPHSGGDMGRRAAVADRARVMDMMNVPDRIVLTGGDGYKGYSGNPRDAIPTSMPSMDYKSELSDLPDHLTISHEGAYPDEPTVGVEDVRSQSSIAIDENPLTELKIMRKQLSHLSSRLYQLEDEVDIRKQREKQMFFASLIGFVTMAVMLVLRK